MYFYHDNFGNLRPQFERVQTTDRFTIPLAPEIDWVEIIAKAAIIGGGLYLAARGIEALLPRPQRSRRPTPRDTFRYILKDGRKGVQFGITNNPPVRCSQHVAAGKQFSVMEIVGPAVTRVSAREWEYDRIETHRTLRGRRPIYNKVS
jgi:hypothetical protein